MQSKRIISGAQPTSDSFHLGNYLGAMQNWVKMQQSFEALFFVPNLHAITVQQNPQELHERTMRAVAMYLAMGIQPETSPIFIQSQIPAHTELAWVLTCLTGLGEAQRMTQFKDKSSKNDRNINVGLLAYPILMAADILLYKADLVPVGADQKQHLELARELANRFNARYGEIFTVPEPYILDKTAKIYDLQHPTQKMSKSAAVDNGIIWILDKPEINLKKLKSAVTDNDGLIKYDPVNKPGVSNLLAIQAALQEISIPELEHTYATAGYGKLKLDTAEILETHLAVIRKKFTEYINNKDYLSQVIRAGAERATELADSTLAQVYTAVGLYR